MDNISKSALEKVFTLGQEWGYYIKTNLNSICPLPYLADAEIHIYTEYNPIF